MSIANCKLPPVHVVMAFNKPYAVLAAACLASLSSHAAPGRHYTVHILQDDLDIRTRRLLGQCLQQSHVTLNFITCDAAVIEKLAGTAIPRSRIWTYHALSKLFLQHLLPQLTRVIWLDADTICQTDIGELYDADLEGRALGAVRDSGPIFRNPQLMRKTQSANPNAAHLGSYHYIYTRMLGLSEQDLRQYFNSGVLLFDLSMAAGYLADCRPLLSKPLPHFDQDVLNILLRGQVKLLDERWNIMPFELAEFEEHRGCAPAIIHNTVPKPWKCAPDQPGAMEFWAALRNTPLWSVALERHLAWREESLGEALPALQTARLLSKDTAKP